MSADGAVVTITSMNANSFGVLEGTLEGPGVNGTSLFQIDTGPTPGAIAFTFADYTVTNVDLDGNGSFDESFSFRIDFSSDSLINFSPDFTSMGIGANGTIDLGEQFEMAMTVLSDTSSRVDVVDEGMDRLTFSQMGGTDLGVDGTFKSTVVEIDDVDSVARLGDDFVDPEYTYLDTGNVNNSGTLLTWNLSFATEAVAIPEPSGMLLVVAVAMLAINGRRRRNRALPPELRVGGTR